MGLQPEGKAEVVGGKKWKGSQTQAHRHSQAKLGK